MECKVDPSFPGKVLSVDPIKLITWEDDRVIALFEQPVRDEVIIVLAQVPAEDARCDLKDV
jgi:hypothetical protein